MGSTFSQITADVVIITGDAAQATHAVRKGQVDALLAPLSAASHAAVTLLNTNQSVVISQVGQQLSAAARLLASFAANQGQIAVTGAGELYIVLGSGANAAAAGNHSHADATALAAGFMTPAMLAAQDAAVAALAAHLANVSNPHSVTAAQLGLGVKGANIASAATTNLVTATGDWVDVTGNTTITSLGTGGTSGMTRTVRFTGSGTLTHNAPSLILPGGANISRANGDVAEFRCLSSGNWICTQYQRINGKAVVETPGAAVPSNPGVGFVRSDGSDTNSGAINSPKLTWQGAYDAGFKIFDFGVGTFGDLLVGDIMETVWINGVGIPIGGGTGTQLGNVTRTGTGELRLIGNGRQMIAIGSVSGYGHPGSAGVGYNGPGGVGGNCGSIGLYDLKAESVLARGGDGGVGGPGSSGGVGGVGGNGGTSGGIECLRCHLEGTVTSRGGNGGIGGAGDHAGGSDDPGGHAGAGGNGGDCYVNAIWLEDCAPLNATPYATGGDGANGGTGGNGGGGAGVGGNAGNGGNGGNSATIYLRKIVATAIAPTMFGGNAGSAGSAGGGGGGSGASGAPGAAGINGTTAVEFVRIAAPAPAAATYVFASVIAGTFYGNSYP